MARLANESAAATINAAASPINDACPATRNIIISLALDDASATGTGHHHRTSLQDIRTPPALQPEAHQAHQHHHHLQPITRHHPTITRVAPGKCTRDEPPGKRLIDLQRTASHLLRTPTRQPMRYGNTPRGNRTKPQPHETLKTPTTTDESIAKSTAPPPVKNSRATAWDRANMPLHERRQQR